MVVLLLPMMHVNRFSFRSHLCFNVGLTLQLLALIPDSTRVDNLIWRSLKKVSLFRKIFGLKLKSSSFLSRTNNLSLLMHVNHILDRQILQWMFWESKGENTFYYVIVFTTKLLYLLFHYICFKLFNCN